MHVIDSIDPFVMQLIIVPVVVIGLGVAAALKTSKAYVAPMVTLMFNLIYEMWWTEHYYPHTNFEPTAYNIIYPVIALIAAATILTLKKQSIHMKTN